MQPLDTIWLVMEGLYIETVSVKSVQDIPIDTLSRMRKQCFIWLLRMPCQRRNRRSPIFMHWSALVSAVCWQSSMQSWQAIAMHWSYAVTTVFPLCIERQWTYMQRNVAKKRIRNRLKKRKTIFSPIMALIIWIPFLKREYQSLVNRKSWNVTPAVSFLTPCSIC